MGEKNAYLKYKRCINCIYKGEVCGQTNYIDKEHKRAPMYKCLKHPEVMPFHFKTLACEDYQRNTVE